MLLLDLPETSMAIQPSMETVTKKKPPTKQTRVVVTGMGVETPIGNNPHDFYTNLLQGVSGITQIQAFDCSNYPTRIAGEIKNYSTNGWVAPKLSKRMDRFMLYMLTAGKKALADAGLTEDHMDQIDKTRCGVLIGSAMGGMKVFNDAIEALRVSYRKMNPFCVPFATTNMGSAMLAMDLGWMGPNYSISTACATSNFCILNAANHIIRGEADVMLCGGSDAVIIPIGLGGFVACRALSERNSDPAKASRPWDSIYLAIDLAIDCKDTQADLWSRITRDEYMAYAVQECYYSIEKILLALVEGEGKLWVERIFREINNSIAENSLVMTLDLKKLPLVLSRFNALTGLLIMDETPQLAKGVANAVYQLYEVVTHGLLSSDLSEQIDTWNIVARARNEGLLFSDVGWPRDPDIKEQVKRLHLLLKVKDSAANVPKNLEARRRLEFFTNSLFMHMPAAKPVSEMMPFCVFTPYYSETVLYSSHDLWQENEDGISTIFYLQKIFPDEWENFLERIGRGNSGDVELQDSATDALEFRFWVSYRGQTLARTVRGMMYYRRALMLQSYLENRSLGAVNPQASLSSQGFQLSDQQKTKKGSRNLQKAKDMEIDLHQEHIQEKGLIEYASNLQPNVTFRCKSK